METKTISWVYSYMLIVTIVICVIAALTDMLRMPIIIILFLISITAIIVLWNRPLNKKSLYLLNIFNLLGASLLANLIVRLLVGSIEEIIIMIITIIAADVFSFTRKGKKTLNARLIRNHNTLARLSICLPIPNKPGLQAIIGVGDLYFYSTMILFSLHNFGSSGLPEAFLFVLVGQAFNILLIIVFINKDWYKGFPATLFPGLCYLAGVLVTRVF